MKRREVGGKDGKWGRGVCRERVEQINSEALEEGGRVFLIVSFPPVIL